MDEKKMQTMSDDELTEVAGGVRNMRPDRRVEMVRAVSYHKTTAEKKDKAVLDTIARRAETLTNTPADRVILDDLVVLSGNISNPAQREALQNTFRAQIVML